MIKISKIGIVAVLFLLVTLQVFAYGGGGSGFIYVNSISKNNVRIDTITFKDKDTIDITKGKLHALVSKVSINTDTDKGNVTITQKPIAKFNGKPARYSLNSLSSLQGEITYTLNLAKGKYEYNLFLMQVGNSKVWLRETLDCTSTCKITVPIGREVIVV
jgi:hypothetical protein